jgi:hypothetical protein
MVEQRELRNVFGQFASGVTVITCRNADGNPHGATVTAFTAVSMQPRLCQVTMTRNSKACAYLSAAPFAVNVLAADQVDTAMHFAGRPSVPEPSWAVGPAVGGLVVAAVGAGWVFALNAVSFVAIAAVVASWRAPVRADGGPRERLVEALWAGGRYVRHALIVRRLLYRAVLFIPAAGAIWALLPVVAAGNLHLGAAGYGLLLGMVGIGAVAGALVIPRLRAGVGSARLVTGAMVVTAVAIVVVATVSNAVLVGIALLPIGGAWIAVMSSLNSGLQLALPNWVRARGLAYYLVVFQGAQALGAVIWGVVADRTSVTTALLIAAAVLVTGALAGLRSPMPDTANLDRTPTAHWPAPQLMFTPDAADGPILVTLTYRVAEDNAVAFTEAMRHVGRSRRRTGALRWELFRDGGEPTRFVESYLVGTWAEHVRQRENRLTGADRRFEEQARGYALGEPQVAHLFPPPANEPPKR